MTADAPAASPRVAPSRARRFATWLHVHPGARLRLLLAGPLFWMVVIYLGSLAILLLNAFWTSDSFTGKVNPFDWSLEAFRQIFENEAYRTIAIRTIVIAALVTVTDAVLAFPIAYYMRAWRALGGGDCWSWPSSCPCGRRTSSRSSPGGPSSRATAS